jgi:hypothetical protein
MYTHMKTTVEIPDPLLERTRAVAAREGTTLRALIEEGLQAVLRSRQSRDSFVLRDASFGGKGVSPEFAQAGWDELRGATYQGRGG